MPPAPAAGVKRAGAARNFSRHPPQQKYQVRPPTSAWWRAPATSTIIPQTGSRCSRTAITGRPAGARAGSAGAARRTRTISARIETAISSGARAPMSRPAGLWIRARACGSAPPEESDERISPKRFELATTPRYSGSVDRAARTAASSRSPIVATTAKGRPPGRINAASGSVQSRSAPGKASGSAAGSATCTA